MRGSAPRDTRIAPPPTLPVTALAPAPPVSAVVQATPPAVVAVVLVSSRICASMACWIDPCKLPRLIRKERRLRTAADTARTGADVDNPRYGPISIVRQR